MRKILIRGGYSGKEKKNIQGINEHAITPILGGLIFLKYNQG